MTNQLDNIPLSMNSSRTRDFDARATKRRMQAAAHQYEEANNGSFRQPADDLYN